METKRLTATEKEALVRMNVALEVLTKEPQYLRERAALIPGAKRDLAMIAKRIEGLMEQFALTIPQEQARTYLNALGMASYVIGVRRPGDHGRDDKNYGMWLPNEVINALVDGCHDHCLMCSADTEGRKRCHLRKMLDTLPNDGPDRGDGDCPYYELM